MDIDSMKPSENYNELKIQFNALKRILSAKQAQINVYERRIKEFSVDRIIQLESQLEYEEEINSILTEELISKSE